MDKQSKDKGLNEKQILIIFGAISLLLIIFTLIPYFLKFKGHTISNDPESWSQFGDYVGGLLNPLLAILNLGILTYISVKVIKIEDKRNEWTLQELARPLGELKLDIFSNKIAVIFINCGLGPLFIKNIKL